MLTVYKQITIKTLAKQGEKKTQIARQVGCHRNTVHNVLGRNRVIKKQRRQKPSVFDSYHGRIKEWLEKKVTRVRIHEILLEEYGVSKNYDTLCKYIQKHFPKQAKAYGVQVVGPGEMAEVDFGYLGMLPGLTGKLVKAWGLAVVLGYSRQSYWSIVYDQQLATLVKELTKAFEFFGGVPRNLKVDNLKAAILRNLHYDLEYNQDFLEFAQHYGTVIIPCSPYQPQQKGKVEAGIKYLQGNFVNGRQFKDSHDLRSQLKSWVKKANHRVHGTTKKIPSEVFRQAEQEKLQALPEEEFAFFNRGKRKVNRNCHLHFQQNYYSVPACLVGKEVTVRWNDHLLRITYQGEQVALHKLALGQGEYITRRSHLPDYKSYSQTEYQAKYEEKMANIGESAHQYFRQLVKKKRGYWRRTVRGILGLVVDYGKEAVEASLARALYFDVANLVIIKNILAKRLYEQELEPKLPTQSSGAMSRDLSYYHQA